MRNVQSEIGCDMYIFDSVLDMTQYADKRKFHGDDGSFAGMPIKTWEELEQKSAEAWEDGQMELAAFVERLRKEKIPDLTSHTKKTTFSTEGDEPDYDKMMQGDPNFFRTSEREETTGPTEVTVIIDTTTPGHMHASNILWRGAVAIALSMLLEEKGYKVEIWVINGSRAYVDAPRMPLIFACCLKKCSDPIDASTLVNTVSGWFYRTAFFTLIRTAAYNGGHDLHWGLGEAYEPRPKDLDQVSRDELRFYSSGVFSFSAAVDCMLGELSKFASKDQGKEGGK